MNNHVCNYDSDGGMCRICGKTVSEQLFENDYYMKYEGTASFEIKGLMPKRRRTPGHNFPVSRDWEDIDCKSVGCRYNRVEKCMVPSRCKISNNGQCTGFEASNTTQQIQKVDGD